MEGLTKQEVKYRYDNGLVNNQTVKHSRDIKSIILSNVLTLFNLLNIGLAILVLTTGSIQNVLFVNTIIFNTIIAIFQEIKAKRILDKLSISNQELVTVIREDKELKIKPEELVIDDLMVLESGDDVVVDSIIIKSTVEVDESIVTGESDAILKKKNDSLLSGSIIISGKCYAKVTSIGKDTLASDLIKKASVIKDDSSYLKKVINQILKFVTILIVPTAILLFISQYFYSNQTYAEAVLSTVAGVIGMIPEGLVLLTSIALTVGVIKMARRKVVIQKLHGIEVLSCVDVLCLDKTGTITDGSMEVVNVISIGESNIPLIIGNILDDNSNNATDIALKKYFNKMDNMKIIKRIPFSSSRKYSKVELEDRSYYLGALEYITKDNIKKYDSYLLKEIEKGYRIITLAEEKNNKIKVIGFIVLKDNVRSNAKETLEYFKKQDVAIKIISGDNPITVSNILKQLQMNDYDKYIDGMSLPEDYEQLKKIVNNYTIFGRVTPYQKQNIIKALRESRTVGMIGDGVNDILALKEADCGIALASGISAARSVSDVVLTTSDFGVLPNIVNEGRRVVNNIERVASLYLVKTTYSFILSILSIILSHEYPFYPIQLSLISAICVGIPSFFLALEPNYKKVTSGFIIKVFRNALPSGICVFINIFLIIMFCTMFNKDFENYRLIVVSLTGLINLRLLYNICKPLNLIREILLCFCVITFFELLILLPNLFLVSRFNILAIVLILIFTFIDIYIIEFLEEIYDKIMKRFLKEEKWRRKLV